MSTDPHSPLNSASSSGSSSSYPPPPHPSLHDERHTQPHSYDEVLQTYERDLKAYAQANSAALQVARERVEAVQKAQDSMPQQARWDSLWFFVPVVVLLWLFVRDLGQRSYAEYTHRLVKEHTQEHSEVKFEKI